MRHPDPTHVRPTAVGPIAMGIGEVRSRSGEVVLYASRPTTEIHVTNTGSRIVRVSSHFPFEQVNARLHFDRSAVAGYHLDIPAGEHVRWGPGETLHVTLVAAKGVAGGPAQPT